MTWGGVEPDSLASSEWNSLEIVISFVNKKSEWLNKND